VDSKQWTEEVSIDSFASTRTAQTFRDLLVWQRSMELTLEVYRCTQGFPREEVYGLTSQMRRSAVSIPSNIAEGQGRGSDREFSRFLDIARGSLCELQTQLEIARSLDFGASDLLNRCDGLSHEVGKMIFAFMRTLRGRSG
jgi:four helix bundle protein